MKQRHGVVPCDDEDSTERPLRVACLSTDYSVQNVLIQMGLSVLSIDGLRIRSAKKWALICRACSRVIRDTTKLFCSHCGNSGLRRVALTVRDDGTEIVEEPLNRRINLRGRVYPIPKPKGGRKGDLILCEDQMLIGGRDRLLRQQQKAWDKELAARDPFNPDNLYEQKGWQHRTLEGVRKGPRIGLGPGNPNSKRWHLKHNGRK
ncbi:RNA-binding protein NOB1-like [Condylostylus longicornis]|uniref:RNA-binding protein NOB1-like n=1 Tax=Condylostylus longicornis TaxID=2530218 RepID=UPI00244DB37B|nr:RNA-binding protein NOB1-like [Condylostylus longicornis]